MANTQKIIPFDQFQQEKPKETIAETMARMAVTFSRMEEDLNVQKTGIRVFQKNTQELMGIFGEMKDGLVAFNERTDKIRIGSLHKKSQRLAQAADRWMAHAS